MATVKNSTMYLSSLCATVKAESEWTSSDPVLKAGEIAISTEAADRQYYSYSDGKAITIASASITRVKVGDGTHKWSGLKYLDSFNADDIAKTATLSAAAIYALQNRCKTLESSKTSLESRCSSLESAKSSLESRCTTLEGAVKDLSEALLKMTNSIITNVTRKD